MKLNFASIAAVSVLLGAASLSASSAHTWVSATGNDSTGTGTTARPYATFQTAMNNTAAGGLISVMGPGDYGPINVIQSVTIDGTGGGSITFTGVEGIYVDPSVAASVVLRNLTVDGTGVGTDAIFVSPNTSNPTAFTVNVVIDGCRLEGFTQIGVGVGSTGLENVVVRNTTIVGGALGVRTFQSSGGAPYDRVTVEHSTIQGATSAGVFTRNGAVDIRNSEITQNLTGIEADTTSTLNVQNSNITGNTDGVCIFSTSTAIIGSSTLVADNTTNNGACGGAVQGMGGPGPAPKP